MRASDDAAPRGERSADATLIAAVGASSGGLEACLVNRPPLRGRSIGPLAVRRGSCGAS